MWRCCFEQRQGRRNGERTVQASIGIALNRIAAQFTVVRVLGNDAPEQHQFSMEQVGTRLVAALRCNHKGEAVGSGGIVRRQASSDGRGKLRNKPLSMRGRLRAVAGQGQDQHMNQALLASKAPGLESKRPRHGDGALQPVVESGAAECHSEVEMPTKVGN